MNPSDNSRTQHINAPAAYQKGHIYEKIVSDGFYAHYLFMDTATHRTYTSIFGINVLNLSRIDEATDADKASGLVYWAKLFSAATWEDLRSISNARPDLKEAAMTMYSANVQSSTRTLMEAHNKYLSDLATLTKYKEDAMRLQDELENYKAQNTDLHAQNTELQTQNTDLQTQNTGLQTQLNQKEDELQKLLKLLAANNIDLDS